jgi:NTE family protein
MGDRSRQGRTTALAIQGGGAHGAFAWGVLDRLLEDGLRPTRICGVSSGALCGLAVAQGLARGGPEAARAMLAQLWGAIGRAHDAGPLSRGPLERWLFGWDLSNNLAWASMEAAGRMFSPAQLNPFGHNPLRAVVAGLLDPEALRLAGAPRLFVGATDVQTGQAVIFDNAAISVDVLLASACVPFVFPAVQIEGRHYWDGGYSGNPPLAPLMQPGPPEELLLIRVQPRVRAGVPRDSAEILNRVNEIAFQTALDAELAMLPATVRLHTFAADKALADLPITSKLNPEPDFLRELFQAGRAAAAVAQMDRVD